MYVPEWYFQSDRRSQVSSSKIQLLHVLEETAFVDTFAISFVLSALLVFFVLDLDLAGDFATFLTAGDLLATALLLAGVLDFDFDVDVVDLAPAGVRDRPLVGVLAGGMILYSHVRDSM